MVLTIKGLKRQETNKFINFFKIVQDEAKRKNAVFFLDCGQGTIFENDNFECEDLCGWLIPNKMVEEFESLFLNDSKEVHNFDDFYVFVDFKINENEIEIEIDDNDFIIDNFNVVSTEVKEKDAE